MNPAASTATVAAAFRVRLPARFEPEAGCTLERFTGAFPAARPVRLRFIGGGAGWPAAVHTPLHTNE